MDCTWLEELSIQTSYCLAVLRTCSLTLHLRCSFRLRNRLRNHNESFFLNNTFKFSHWKISIHPTPPARSPVLWSLQRTWTFHWTISQSPQSHILLHLVPEKLKTFLLFTATIRFWLFCRCICCGDFAKRKVFLFLL